MAKTQILASLFIKVKRLQLQWNTKIEPTTREIWIVKGVWQAY
uniref:Uncharacterized protein n=1 Tax=Rhizophora mucronata TaxID=61149 RepID=A0A2P2PHD5_RHIMU